MEIREIAVPAPKKGEILIKVEWAGYVDFAQNCVAGLADITYIFSNLG